MLLWALILFIITMTAALLGFGGIAGTAAGIARFLLVIFLLECAICLIMDTDRRPRA